jgi:hypothetical protein
MDKPTDQLSEEMFMLRNKALSLVDFLFENQLEKMEFSVSENINGDICVFLTNNPDKFKLDKNED